MSKPGPDSDDETPSDGEAAEEFAERMRAAREAHEANPSEPWQPELAAPPRPESIPATAEWDEQAQRWSAGEKNGAGERRGSWKSWAMNGTLLTDKTYDESGKDLFGVSYYPDGTMSARITRQPDGNTLHECFFPDRTPWCTTLYRGDAFSGQATEDQVIKETLRHPDGRLRHELVNERDEAGLVRHQHRGPDGALVFENARTPRGRELSFYRADGKKELSVLEPTDGEEALAVLHLAGGDEVKIDGSGIDETTRRTDIEGELGGRLFAVTIATTKRPDAVAAFAAKNRWAEKISNDAPFANASVVNFLTGLTSAVPHVADVSILGLCNLLDEKQVSKVVPTLEELAKTGAKDAVVRTLNRFRAVFELDEASLETALRLAGPVETEDDADDDDDDGGDDESETTIGAATLPSGRLAIVDMGALGQWSHDAPHHADLSGSSWAGVIGKERDDYLDLVVTGADATKVFGAFVKEHGAAYLFDVEKHHVAHARELFAKTLASSGLSAELAESPHRIGHGARIRMLEAAGLAFGELGFAHVNVVCVFGLPKDREMPVVGKRNDDGEWEYVSLVCKDTATASAIRVGSLSVEEARFLFADAEALRAWDHERTIDGLRDLVFWGGAADELVERFGVGHAYANADYHGWADVPPGTVPPHFVGAVIAAMQEQRLCVEMRMHSSHHAILRGAWTSPNEAGTATIGGAKMCGLFSSVGDGAFPVYLERDEAGDICRVTVKVASDEDEDEDDDDDDDDEDEDEDD